MGYSVQIMNTDKHREDALTLEILDAVQRQSAVSQRHLAQQLGVALGLANSYLKRCVRKGFIKITEAPANRYLYYITPKGFAEKSRLTAQYLSYSFSFYRQASESCLRVFSICDQNGWNKLLLCGISDLAEIATLRAMEQHIEIVAFYDPHSERKVFLNRPVWRRLENLDSYDACVVTDFLEPQMTYEHLVGVMGLARVLVPDVLRLDNRPVPGSAM
jgi:DNA-binding MarR family transcriptional regulator